MLRHTYATIIIVAGIPVEVLQKLLGHKYIQPYLIDLKEEKLTNM